MSGVTSTTDKWVARQEEAALAPLGVALLARQVADERLETEIEARRRIVQDGTTGLDWVEALRARQGTRKRPRSGATVDFRAANLAAL